MPKYVHCAVCDLNVSLVSDRMRHKCTSQRQLPTELQSVAVPDCLPEVGVVSI